MDEQLRIMGTLGFEEESERTAIEAPTDQIIHILNATPDEHRLSVMVSVLVS